MKSKVFLYLVMTFLAVMITAQASQIEIDIMDKVTLKEKIITIRDISQVTGDDDTLIKKINDIEVGKTPWPNNHRRIDRDFFKMRLVSSGIGLSDIVFEGSKAAIVSVEATKITGTEITEKAKEHLLFATQSFNRDITIELENNPGDQWVTKKRDEIYIDASLADGNKNRGNVVVMVMANADGVLLFKIPVRFNVRVFESIAVTKKKIDRHESLTAENVFMARRETTKVSGEIFSDIESLRGKIASTQIVPFAVITEEIIETPPTIKRGDTVKLFIRTENFKIITKGLAQENGVTGEIIKVQNFDTKKVLRGRIVDYENVQILF